MRHRKDFDSEYRLYLRDSYFTQINKVRRLLNKETLDDDEREYHVVESLERQLIQELIEFNTFKEETKLKISDDRYIYKERRSLSTYGYHIVIIKKKYYGIFPFKKDAIKRRNEVLLEIGKI